MSHHFRVALLAACAAVLNACASITLAPGADQVHLTDKSSEVVTCKSRGNITVPKNEQGLVDMAVAQKQFRNQVVGLNANVGLVTEGLMRFPSAGVAYRCP